MTKPIKWYNETSLPLVKIRNRNGQLVIPIPKRSAEKHGLKADMDVHPVIFWRTESRHKRELKSDEVMPILKKKEYIRFKRWKQEEDNKINAILKSIDSPEDLDDKELEALETTLGKKATQRIKELKENIDA